MKTLLVMMTIALTLTGCGANAEPGQADATQTLPAGHPPTGAPAGDAGVETISGKVAETMSGGGYTYMRIASESGETWVAVPLTEVETGQEMTIAVQMTMTDFTSTALDRTFESLVFGTVGGGASPASPHGMSGMGGMGMGSRPAVDLGDISVPKADGANAKTVEELWAQRTDLADKTVVVRGKVVKFLPSIMGRNWVHLRDGSGTDEAANNDITITTDATVTVGDVVVAQGVVRVDKDLGAGYMYPVILEDGSFK